MSVETLDRAPSSKIQNGYFVFYVAALYENDPTEYRAFSRTSSPTESISINAGEYLLWSQKEQTAPSAVPKSRSSKTITEDAKKPLQVLVPG